MILLIDCAGSRTTCIHIRTDLFMRHVGRGVWLRRSNEDVIRVAAYGRLLDTLIQNYRRVIQATNVSCRLLARRVQIVPILATIKFVHRNIHRVFEFSSLVLIEID